MNAICLVAHPDDCIIFGYSYIHNHPEYNWTIGYLTYTEQDPRGNEIAAFWQRRGIPCVFLGYVDNYHDLETRQISFDTESAVVDLQELADRYDLVLTHDRHGDYGHLHHVFVHDCVQHHTQLVTFADLSSGTVTLEVPAGTYAWNELPQHQEIIRAFFPEGRHQNNYTEVAK
jgi:LmbE family N-acetylglucosaminyl deacetylase